MLNDRAAAEENHERFVRRVIDQHEVWGLKSSEGWAICDSNEQQGAQVMPFWSDRAYAQRAAKDGWAHYVPTLITLDQFLDRWLPGMQDDGRLVGTNWDANNCGIELTADALSKQLRDQQQAASSRSQRR